jgi:predicted DNA-binding protein
MTALLEFRKGEALLDEILADADNPNANSRREESMQHFEAGTAMVRDLPDELRQLYSYRLQGALEERAGDLANSEANWLSGIDAIEKRDESLEHYRKAESALRRLRTGLSNVRAKYAQDTIDEIATLLLSK